MKLRNITMGLALLVCLADSAHAQRGGGGGGAAVAVVAAPIRRPRLRRPWTSLVTGLPW